MRIVGRTHDADGIAVRIADDGVPGSPEGVIRRLLAGVAGGHQLAVEAVDRGPVGDAEPEDNAGAPRPTFVPHRCEPLAVEVDVDPVDGPGVSVVGRPLRWRRP